MDYPGGKNGAGVFQTLINHMPPHRVYLEPFLGGGAVLRLKRPAALSIAADREPGALELAIASLAETCEEIPLASLDDVGRELRRQAKTSAFLRGRLPEASPTAASGVYLYPPPATAEDRALDVLGDAPVPGAGQVAHRQNQRADPTAVSGEPGRARQPQRCSSGPQYWFLETDGIGLLERYPFQGDELVYCDPPYVHSTRRGRRLYQFEMSDRDHARLLRAIRRLPCRVMLSGYWSKLYGDWMGDWHSLTFQTTNRAGQKTTEWLWMNYPEPIELHDYRYLGRNFREREKLKRRRQRWSARLARMQLLERRALLSAIAEAWNLL